MTCISTFKANKQPRNLTPSCAWGHSILYVGDNTRNFDFPTSLVWRIQWYASLSRINLHFPQIIIFLFSHYNRPYNLNYFWKNYTAWQKIYWYEQFEPTVDFDLLVTVEKLIWIDLSVNSQKDWNDRLKFKFSHLEKYALEGFLLHRVKICCYSV